MAKYSISFYDKNDALRTGITDDESWEDSGVWIIYEGERIFIKNENIRKDEKLINSN